MYYTSFYIRIMCTRELRLKFKTNLRIMQVSSSKLQLFVYSSCRTRFLIRNMSIRHIRLKLGKN